MGNNSFFESVLQQIATPPGYACGHLRNQVVVFMAENTLEFAKKLQRYLKQNHITYQSYLQGISDGVIRVDRFIVSAISKMWNISISVVSPVYNSEWKIHHDATEADILIVSNGHQLGHAKEATHYSPTESTLKSWKKVGHDVVDLSVRIIEGEAKGEKLGTKTFMLQEAEQILRQHYKVSKKND